MEVSVKVTNSGALDGEEVVQAYVGMEYSRIDRQKKLLKGFKKVFIRAGETVDVTITIPIARPALLRCIREAVALRERHVPGDGRG